MHPQILVVVITDVDCARAVLRELVGGGAADAEGGVGAGDDGDAGLKPSGGVLAGRLIGEKRGGGEVTDGPGEEGAMCRILGMVSKVPGSGGGTTSCSLRAWRRRLGAEVMFESCGKGGLDGMLGRLRDLLSVVEYHNVVKA